MCWGRFYVRSWKTPSIHPPEVSCIAPIVPSRCTRTGSFACVSAASLPMRIVDMRRHGGRGGHVPANFPIEPPGPLRAQHPRVPSLSASRRRPRYLGQRWGAEPLEPFQVVIETPGKAARCCAASKQQPFTLGEPVFRDVLANGFSRYWAFSARTFAAFL